MSLSRWRFLAGFEVGRVEEMKTCIVFINSVLKNRFHFSMEFSPNKLLIVVVVASLSFVCLFFLIKRASSYLYNIVRS